MSRKDFQAIADTIRDAEGFATEYNRAGFAATMADTLASTNPRFDRSRFLAACKPRWVVGTTKERYWDKIGA